MNTRCVNSASKKGLLIKCLLISLGAHVCFLAYFYISPLVLHHARSPFALSSASATPLETDDAEGIEKNQIIDEVFKQIVLLSPHQQLPFDLKELPKGSALAPDLEEQEMPFEKIVKIKPPIQRELSFSTPASDLILAHEIEIVPSLFAPADIDTSVIPQLQIEAELAPLVLFKNPLAYASETDPEHIVSLSSNALVTAHPEEGRLSLESLYGKEAEKLQIRTDKKMLSGTVEIQDALVEEKIMTPLFIPPAAEQTFAQLDFRKFVGEKAYDFSDHGLTSAWNDDFDVEVTYLPNPDGEGYIFSATITPNKEISAFSLKQNIYFVLDRSGTIAKHRFAVFKRAVLKGLASMQKDDTFNIVLVDKKITRFKTENVVATLKNIRAAETFLDKQEGGGFFDSNDIYSSLEKLLPHIPDNDEMHTIVLLTDGKTKLNTERKHKALKNWLEENNTRVALYAAAVGGENDLVTLDLLSTVSGGKLLYSDTHASFPRKIAKLMIDLKNPLAKNIAINAIPHDSNTNITFQNARPHMPALFSHTPYVVYGTIDKPGNFDLIVHGRHRNQWVGISKEIAFTEENRHDIEFATRWGEQLANLCYSKFLKEGKVAHLKEAKEILKKSRTQVAF